MLARGAGGVGDGRDGEAVSRAPAASSWFASVARSRVAAAMALLLVALVALVRSDSGLRAAALGSGAGSAARRHGDPASSHVHRAGRGSWRGRAKFRDDDVSGASTSSILRNAPGPIPGLVEHVDAVSGATKFRLVSFCNRAYWPFLHVATQSVRAAAPDMLPYWTVLVPDEGTAEFVRDKASDVDVFVDDDLRNIVAANAEKFDDTPDGERAERAELRRLMSWRRVHAMHGLLDAGYTAVFIEPDVVFAGDPTNVLNEVLTRADVAVGSDYGRGKYARRHANTKVLVAKPTASAKALFAEWQGAEANEAMRGGSTRTERAYLLRTILREGRKRRGSGAVVEVLDETAVASYLSHPADDMDDASNDDGASSLGARGSTRTIERPVMITGGGCDDVNYKLNWLNQAVLRYALPPGPEGRKPLDFEAVRAGCDEATRRVAMRERARKGGKHHHREHHRRGDDDEYE